MKIEDSGMPEESYWRSFFDPEYIFSTLEIRQPGIVADFGAGYGVFTFVIAHFAEKVYALDIDPSMIEHICVKSHRDNIIAKCLDFTQDCGLDDSSIDTVLLFNILHGDDLQPLLSEVNRILKANGLVAVIHWNYDDTTPRGPPMTIRKSPHQIIELFESLEYKLHIHKKVGKYHFGQIFKRS
ncbi:MAG: class I SAM-dependent methyltransferase [Candidatus Heimdallarchaeota archaeon]|nr:class I SAM-dependent methyltransferase [Candidatus Heimdallarchaeota archaeon]